MSKLFSVQLFSVLLVVTFSFPLAWAQITTGEILGTVHDSTGAVLPGTEITVTHVDTNISRTVISGDDGRYAASNLNLGNYDVAASLPGFQTSVQTGVELTIGRRAVVNVTLTVGEITERVTVTSETPLVETTTGSLGSLVDRRTVMELPLNGRDLTGLLTLQAGTAWVTTGSQSTNAGFSKRVSIAGARPQDSAVLLDGTATKGTDQGVPAGTSGHFLGSEGIQEFKIERNSYSAQYGGASGGVINVVSKAGANQFHGSVYEFHRNDVLDATNFFANRSGLEKPPLIRNQFGFSLGGPIVKDKTFFFWNYEGYRERSSRAGERSLPVAATRLGRLPGHLDASGKFIYTPGEPAIPVPGMKPEVLPYFALWPDPSATAVDRGDGTAREGHTSPSSIDEDYYQIRVDHNFSDSDSIFGRFTFEDSSKNKTLPVDRWTGRDFVENRFLTLEHKHIFSAATLNTFRFGFGRRNGGAEAFENCSACTSELRFIPDADWQSPLGAEPAQGQISITGLASVGVGAACCGVGWQVAETDNYNYQNDVVHNRGAHSLKFGFTLWHLLTGGENPSRPAGVFAFQNLTNFLLAKPRTFRGAILPGIEAKRMLSYEIMGWYLQDDWQVTPRLTLNLGVRHEFYTIPTERDGKISNLKNPLTDTEVTVLGTRGDAWFENSSIASIAPRIGIAWDPTGTGKTAIRLGGGLFYNHVQPDIFRRAIFRSTPFMKETNFGKPTPAFPDIWDQVVVQGIGNEDMQPFAYSYMGNPHMYQWNMNIQQEVFPGTAATVGYVGSRGLNLMHQTCINSAKADVVNGRYTFASDASRPNTSEQFGDLCLLSQEAATNSFHHGLNLSLERRFADGLQFQVAYSWSKTVSESDQVNGLYANQGNGVSYFHDPDLSRSLAAFHVGRTFTFSGVWQLPFGNDLGGAAEKLLGGWQLSGIVRMADGPPLSIQMSTPKNLRNLGYNGRSMPPDLVPGKSTSPVLGGADKYFETSGFTAPPSRTIGTLGRNTLIGAGLANFDMSLTKNTYAGESLNVQFRAEFFNIFNRPNFARPDSRVMGSTGAPNRNAGRISQTTITERQIQLGLRLEF